VTIGELKKYIYEHNKIEYVLESLQCHNIKYHDNNNYYSAAFNDGDNPQGVIIQNNEYLNFSSFSRSNDFPNEANDIITLVEYITKKSFVDSIKYLHNILGLEYKWKRDLSIQKEKKEEDDPLFVFKKIKRAKKMINVADIDVVDEEELNEYVPILHIDWVKEGIAPWTRKKFGLMYSYKRKRVIIPIRHWLTKELVGFNMRTIIANYEEFDIPKYWITPTYQKSQNLYGLAENYDSIVSKKIVTVFEGEKSTLKRDSLLDDTCVSLQGKTMSNEQAAILIGLNAEIVLALDKDVDINEVRHMCEKFYRIRPVSYIYDKWGILDEKDSPTDKGRKVYEFLFKHRIRYGEEEHCQYLKSLEKK
jgi:DNA primase